MAVPATANVCIIEATTADATSRTEKGDIILTRVGKTTGSLQSAETNSVNNLPTFLASWSGSTITIT